MSKNRTFPPSDKGAAQAHIDFHGYQKDYAKSLSDPDTFWAEHGKRIEQKNTKVFL